MRPLQTENEEVKLKIQYFSSTKGRKSGHVVGHTKFGYYVQI